MSVNRILSCMYDRVPFTHIFFTHSWLMHHLSMGINEWTASKLPPCSLPQKKAQKLQLCSKQSSKRLTRENYLAIDGCLECNTYHVVMLGWLKKDERRISTISNCFWFATIK